MTQSNGTRLAIVAAHGTADCNELHRRLDVGSCSPIDDREAVAVTYAARR